jgi:hypothetical protein
MYNTIVNIVINMCNQRGITGLDDIKDFLEIALEVSEAQGLSWSDQDFSDMLDDILLGLDHPGESFAEPLN